MALTAELTRRRPPTRVPTSSAGSPMDRYLSKAARVPPTIMQRAAAKPADDPRISKIANANVKSAQAAFDANTLSRRQFNTQTQRDDLARVASNQYNRKVLELLDKIRDGVLSSSGDKAGLLDAIGGAAVLKSLLRGGAGMKSAGRVAAAGKMFRNSKGQFIKRPAKWYQRVGSRLANTRVGRAAGALAEKTGLARVVTGLRSGKGALGLVGKVGGKVGRVAGKFALPIAALMAVTDAVQGVKNADTTLGRKASNADKIGIAVSSAIDGALLGIPSFITHRVFGKNTNFAKSMNNMGSRMESGFNGMFSTAMSLVLGATTKITSGVIDYFKGLKGDIDGLVKSIQDRDWKTAGGYLAKIVKETTPVGGIVAGAEAIARPTAASMQAFAAGATTAVDTTITTGRAAGKAVSNAAQVTVTAGKAAAGKVSGTLKANYLAARDNINAAADEFKLDRKDFAARALTESRFQTGVKAGTSSATGLYQFIGETWLGEVGKALKNPKAPAEFKAYAPYYKGNKFIGPDNVKAELLALRSNPRLNAWLGAQFMVGNNAYLAKNGIAQTAGNSYLAHFLGAGGARQLLTADPNAIAANVAGAKAANANRTVFYHGDKGRGPPKTVREVVQWAADKTAQHRATVISMDGPTAQATAKNIAVSPTMAQAKNGAATKPTAASMRAFATGSATPVAQTTKPAATATPKATAVPKSETLNKPLPDMPKPKPALSPQAQAALAEERGNSPAKLPAKEVTPPASSHSQGSQLPPIDAIPTYPSLELLAVAGLSYR